MNKSIVKKIKSIINYQKDDPTSKRTYRGIKSEYTNLSCADRIKYLNNLTKLFS
jgi:hypothetical protein